MAIKAFYPGASEIREPSKNIRAAFAKGEPTGVTVHYSATRSINATINALNSKKLKYHVLIPNDGRVVQIARLDHRVWHAGKAFWKGDSPNQSHLSVCVLSWGLLNSEGKSWTGAQIRTKHQRLREGQLWDGATDSQEAALMHFLRWAINTTGVKAENICGHDECCLPPGRKQDPGGIFSFTIPELRERLSHGIELLT
jgi:N-acetyl-anhydromuramyl-L-alanine amidase AmpD